MMNNFIRAAASCLTAVAFVALVAAPIPANAKTVIKVAKVAGDENTLENWVVQRLGQLVSERTGGELEIQVFFGKTFGSGVQMIEGVKLGTLHGTYNTLAAFSTWVPQGTVFNLPFIFRDDDHVLEVTNGSVGRMVAEYFEPQGFHVSAFWNVGSRNPVGHYAITSIEDAVGKKVRVKANPVAIKIWKAVGANPTPIPWAEVRNAMDTRTIDLYTTLGSAYWDMKLFEAAPHYSHLGITHVVYAMAWSKKFWDTLSPEHQQIIDDAARELATMQHHMIGYMNVKGPVLAARAGAKVNFVRDKEPWAAAMKDIWGEWASDVEDGQKLIDAIRAVK